MAFSIALLALGTIVGVAVGIAMLMGLAYAWSVLGLGGFAALAAVLLVLRHRYAEPSLRMVAMLWSPLGLVFLLAFLFGWADGTSPAWAVPALVLALAGSAASILALYSGFAYLREGQRR